MRKVVIPEYIFGAGARRLVGQYAANFSARRALVVSDEGVEAAGWLQEVLSDLETADIGWSCFTGVTANPKFYEVEYGVRQYLRDACDILIAVGGGSPMDCAKGIGILSTNGGDIRAYAGIDAVPLPGPPLICVPTTAGSAADVSQFAIISDPEHHRKLSLVSKSLVPDISLIDPETTLTMDAPLTAYTAVDALTHAMEAAVSRAHWPYTDFHAYEAISRVAAYLPAALAHPNDLTPRTELLYASLLAGIAFSNAGLGLVHAMAHSVAGYYDSLHGETNAILLPHVAAYNYPAAPDAYDFLASRLGLDMAHMPPAARADALASHFRQFNASVGIPRTLSELGVRRDDIPQLAINTMQDVCVATNPRRPRREEIEQLYERAM